MVFKAAFISGIMNPLVGFVSNMAYFGIALGGGFFGYYGKFIFG